MNSQNLQIKGAKAIRLPQDWGHMLRLILTTFLMEEVEERLFKSQERKSGKKYLWKSRKWKTFQHIERVDSIQTHGCIDANQEFTRYGNHHNILPLFGGLEKYLTFSLLLSYTMKHTHTSQNTTIAKGLERDGRMLTSLPALGVLIIEKLMIKQPLWPNITKMRKLR
jgi:hypothetical protein